MNVSKILKGYNEHEEHEESLSLCIGAQRYLDLSQFEETEIVRSDDFDTYCVIYFCGKHVECLKCKQVNNPQTIK